MDRQAQSTWDSQMQHTSSAGRSHGPESPDKPPTKPCHNCRRQRLRCDRSYPHCNKCIVAGKECLGYGKLFRWTGAVASRGKLAGRPSSAPVDVDADGKNAPRATTTTTTDADTKADLNVKPSNPPPALSRDAQTPVDLSMPEYGGDMQLVLSPSPESLVATPWTLADPLYRDMQYTHRYYLSYFTNRVCKDLVSQDIPERNPFRGLLPLTRAHPLLQHIIVAASAAHMSNLVRAPLTHHLKGVDDGVVAGIEQASRRALQDALVAKSKALALMRGAVENINTTGGDVVLAAALFFINVELIESGKHGWKAHLEGAGRIMSLLQPDIVADTALRDYMLSDCFIYFILASAFMPAASFDTQSYFRPSQIPSILQRAAANSYLCCPPEILTILHSASQLSNVSPDVASEEDVRAAGLVLIQQAQAFDIDAWANDIRNMSYLQDAPIQSRIHAGSAHRLAACLYILQAIPSMSSMKDHNDVAEALSRDIFKHLSSIPDNDPNFKATTWPTFIAGAEAGGRLRREWVMDRLQRLVRCCPWGFIYTAMETLQVIWDLDNKGQGTKSWVQTLKDPQMNFLIIKECSKVCWGTEMDRIISDCILPCSRKVRCLDRFSILGDGVEGEDGLVPFWLLLQSILSEKRNSSSDIIEVLDTISSCLRGSPGTAGDYCMVKQVIDDIGPKFFSTIWPNIVQTALELPEHFPSGTIGFLDPGDCLRLSRNEVACLVSHQFLCTFSAPSWRDGFYDFSIWYNSSQRHPKAVEMYITALFVYFERLHNFDAIADAEKIEYSLHALGSDTIPATKPWNETTLCQAAVVNVPSYSTLHQELACQGINGAVVVSANKDIGFGQSATQEEIYVGNCPEACPAVLFTPTLRPDQVLVISGATPMLRISGQRRATSWSILEPPSKGGRMLFMDALEMDEIDEDDGLLPDIKPHNLKREILKAYTAFSAWKSDETATVWSGLWGCGAFNGDPGVKMCCLWMAASLAGKQLRILCDPLQSEFSMMFERFIGRLGRGSTVAELRNRLDAIPGSTNRLETMEVLNEHES